MTGSRPQAQWKPIHFNGLIAKDTSKDRVDLLQMIAQVEHRLEFGWRQGPQDIRIGFEKLQKIAFAIPGAHGISLHQPIAVFARQTRLGQRQQHALAVHQSMRGMSRFSCICSG